MDRKLNQNSEARSRIYRIILVGILLAGVILRISGLFSSLEYDEIWTLENFANKPLKVIFTDLALPNNHPLNTLGVKFCLKSFDSPCLIRLPALLTGIGSVLLFPMIAFLWTKRKIAALAATFFFTFSHMAIGYAAQARGYSLQLFFLLLFAAGLQLSGKYRPKNYRFLPEIMVFLGGAGAVLTLPTSIIYLGSISLVGWYFWYKRPFSCPAMKIVLAIGAILTIGWYLLNFQALRAAQVWGVPITGALMFIKFVYDTIKLLNGSVILILALIGALLHFRRGWPLLAITAIALGSAIATNAGGARVYLPLVAPGALLAGIGFEAIYRRLLAKKHQIAAIFTILIIGIFLLNWHKTTPLYKSQDWFALYEQIHQIPANTLIALDAGDGYPYTWNNMPQAYKDYDSRLRNTLPQRELISFLPPNILNGTDRNGAAQNFDLNFTPQPQQEKLGEFKICRYRLTELEDNPPANTPILILLRPLPIEIKQEYVRNIYQAYPEVLNLNPWLASNITVRGQNFQGCTLLLRCDDPAKVNWLNLRNKLPHAVSIYLINYL